MIVAAAAHNPLEYVVQHAWPGLHFGPEGITGFTVMSNIIFMQLVTLVLLAWFLPRWLRPRTSGDEIERLTPRGPGSAIEAICVALREQVARPALGPYTDKFIPYIWTVFFFVLTSNLLGLIPLVKLLKPVTWLYIGGTSTGNIYVTATLAICTLLMIVGNGLREHGLGYVKHFFMGPFPVNILIALLEVVGLFAKTLALTVRLFANMVAGHVLLVVLLSFIAMAAAGLGSIVTLTLITPLVVVSSVAINLLELFVAFLQAFIFTFLTTLFIGQAVNIHHEHAAEHGDAPAAGQHAHASAAH